MRQISERTLDKKTKIMLRDLLARDLIKAWREEQRGPGKVNEKRDQDIPKLFRQLRS